MKHFIGEIIRVKVEEGLLRKNDGDVGIVTLVKDKALTDYVLESDFKISKGVLLFEKEIVETLPPENYPEYFL